MPTEWCSGMVPVLKPDSRVRICVDLTKLNQALRREIHPMVSVDESLAKLWKSKFFTKLDANSSFWQLPLCEESKCSSRLLVGLPSTAYHSASVPLLRSSNVTCHRCWRAWREMFVTWTTFCEFSKTSIKFLGHIIDASGIHADSSKTAAIAHSQHPPMSQNFNVSWAM